MKKLSIIMAMTCLLLATQAMAASVTLEWDASTAPDLAGYNVYWAPVTVDGYGTDLWQKANQNPLSEPRYTADVTGRYAFYVTAVDKSGNESDPSNIAWMGDDRTPPDAVIEIRVKVSE